MHLCPPGYDQRTRYPGDLGPVERDDAHAQSAVDSKQLVDGYIIGEYPAQKGEVGEGLEKVPR